MRKRLLLGLVFLVGVVVAGRPREAKAGEPVIDGGGRTIAAVLLVGGTTVSMGIYDLSADDPSRGYGITEAVIHTPIALVWGAAMIDDLDFNNHWDNGGGKILLPVMAGLNATLAIHGMYTAAKSRPSKKRALGAMLPRPSYGRPGMVNVGSVRANMTLTPVSDGRSLGGGLGLAGTF